MFRTTFTFRIARYSFRTKAIHTSFDTKFVSAQFALKFVNAQCVYVNLAGCADWQIGNSDPALLILLTLNLTSRIKNEMIPAIIPMNIIGAQISIAHVVSTGPHVLPLSGAAAPDPVATAASTSSSDSETEALHVAIDIIANTALST